MADIKCKVCGGSINMGKCELCGTTYSIDEIRQLVQSQTAGDILTNSPTDTPNTFVVQSNTNNSISQSNGDLSRDTLILHLSDVRVLETIAQNDRQKLGDLMREKSNKYNEYQKALNSSQTLRKPPNMWEISFTGQKKTNIYIIMMILMILVCYISFSFSVFAEQSLESGIVTLISLVGSIISFICYNKNAKCNATLRKNAYNEALERYNQAKQEVEDSAKQKYDDYVRGYDQTAQVINQELNEITCLLQQAYSINIIPSQFRNIEGIYYLYDYLSTSNQSLSEALMQYNLEAIKSKLDNMIKFQSASLIQQAQANAKMDTMIQQNQQILENSKQSKHYSMISAINSQVIAKLSAKSLAYQRADFWLK